MALGETDAGPRSGTSTVSPRETHRQRDSRLALKQLSFNWNATGKYVELLNFLNGDQKHIPDKRKHMN